MKKLLALVFIHSALLLTSCATTIDAYYAPKAAQFEVKSIYLVSKSPEMDERFERELQKRKIRVVIGPETKTVTTEDAIMKYNETWVKQISRSLTALDVLLFKPDGNLVASSHWENSKFSSLSTMGSIVEESVGIIFEKFENKP